MLSKSNEIDCHQQSCFSSFSLSFCCLLPWYSEINEGDVYTVSTYSHEFFIDDKIFCRSTHLWFYCQTLSCLLFICLFQDLAFFLQWMSEWIREKIELNSKSDWLMNEADLLDNQKVNLTLVKSGKKVKYWNWTRVITRVRGHTDARFSSRRQPFSLSFTKSWATKLSSSNKMQSPINNCHQMHNLQMIMTGVIRFRWVKQGDKQKR